MKVNIYYGGRGLIEDPTIYIMDTIASVLDELRVDVVRYNLYEKKSEIFTLPKTLKEADAIILASTIEWFGIGGFMHQFLDACWLYADKSKISSMLMCPIITSNAYGEREGIMQLQQAWEILGGKTLNGIGVYVDNHTEFEIDEEYKRIIEKEAEDFYRKVNKNLKIFDSSTRLLRNGISRPNSIELSPQENEQLSAYISNDSYVKKQKEDIEELTKLFQNMIDKESISSNNLFIRNIKEAFKPFDDTVVSYSIFIEDLNQSLIIEVEQDKIDCYYGTLNSPDVSIKANRTLMNDLVLGRITLHGAFMSGSITAKGDFGKLRIFDELFTFTKI